MTTKPTLQLKPMPVINLHDRTGIAITCVQVAAYLQIPAGILVVLVYAAGSSPYRWLMVTFMAVLSVASVALSFLAARWLRQGKLKGWITAAVLSGLYMPSLLFPISAVTLWALLSRGTRLRFFNSTPDPW
jgi:hypothetical protein